MTRNRLFQMSASILMLGCSLFVGDLPVLAVRTVDVYTYSWSTYTNGESALAWHTGTIIGQGNGTWTPGSGSYLKGEVHDGDSIVLFKDWAEDERELVLSAWVRTSDREASLVFGAHSETDCWLVVFIPKGVSGVPNGLIALKHRIAGVEETMAWVDGAHLGNLESFNEWALLQVAVRPNYLGNPEESQITVSWDGTPLLGYHTSYEVTGWVGLRIYGLRDLPCHSEFLNVTLLVFPD